MIRFTRPATKADSDALNRWVAHRNNGCRVTRMSDGTYWVDSASVPNLAHEVRIINLGRAEATCDCKGAQRGYRCFHQVAALCEESRRVSPKRTKMAAADVERKMSVLFAVTARS